MDSSLIEQTENDIGLNPEKRRRNDLSIKLDLKNIRNNHQLLFQMNCCFISDSLNIKLHTDEATTIPFINGMSHMLTTPSSCLFAIPFYR